MQKFGEFETFALKCPFLALLFLFNHMGPFKGKLGIFSQSTDGFTPKRYMPANRVVPAQITKHLKIQLFFISWCV